MSVLASYRAVWLILGVVALFLAGHYFVGRDEAKIVMDSLVVGGGLTIFLAWFRAAMSSIRSGIRTGAANVSVAVWMSGSLLMLYFLWVVFFTSQGRPEHLRQLPIAGLFSCMFFVVQALAILTPVNTTEPIERLSLFGWFVAVAAGSTFAGIIGTLTFLEIFPRVG